MQLLPPADRFAENMTDHPFWNESVWFSLAKPEEKLNGIIHYYFRPNMSLLNGGPILWQPQQNFFWNCLYHNWSHLQALPPGAEKFNVTLPNSLTVNVLEPLTRYAIGYDNEGLFMDLVWEAIGPVHEMNSDTAEQANTAKFHLEQPGRMKGMIKVGGRSIPIDGFSMRDASSGPRLYEKIASGSYFWGVAEKSCFHAITFGEGPERKLMGGFMWKDGKMTSLAACTRTALAYGTYGPSLVRVDATDSLGRSLKLTGKVEQGLIHTGYTTHTVVWSQTEWDWDGVMHIGEHQEFCSAVKFRQIARGEIPLGV